MTQSSAIIFTVVMLVPWCIIFVKEMIKDSITREKAEQFRREMKQACDKERSKKDILYH